MIDEKTLVFTMLTDVYNAYRVGSNCTGDIEMKVGLWVYSTFKDNLPTLTRFDGRPEDPNRDRRLLFKDVRISPDPNARNPYAIRIRKVENASTETETRT